MILPKRACSMFASPDKPMANDHACGKVIRRVQHGFVDQDGIMDPGKLKTLPESGITSISLTRTDVTGTNQGHDRGFQGGFTRANGTTGTAETIYLATDRQNTCIKSPAKSQRKLRFYRKPVISIVLIQTSIRNRTGFNS